MIYRIGKYTPKKTPKRRRKLRSLVCRNESEVEQPSSLHSAGLLLIALCLGAAAVLTWQSVPWSNFLATYRDQYNQLVHGQKDYCKPTMDTRHLFSQIDEVVLNQDEALRAIEVQLRNESKFTAIVVVGRTGVGKTLFAHALHERFPWQENTQMLSWRSLDPEDQKREDMESALKYLSDCGRNLITIDDLGPDDSGFVREYTDLALEKVLKTNTHLIVVYVMNIASFTETQREVYDESLDRIRGLESVNVVEFKKFGQKELRECILHEAGNLNYTLDEESLAEVIRLIDVDRSGCKNVHPKVVMFGKRPE